MTVGEFQRRIEAIYLRKDAARGLERTFVWFVEEVGELARDILQMPRLEAQKGTVPFSPASDVPGEKGTVPADAPLAREFADVLAWLSTLASLTGVDLEAAAQAKYGAGCPRCGATPCACAERAAARGS